MAPPPKTSVRVQCKYLHDDELNDYRYILNTEMGALLVFKMMMGLIAVPNVMFNLFL